MTIKLFSTELIVHPILYLTQILLEVNCQVNYFLNYFMMWLGRARFGVESKSKPELQGQGSVEGLESGLKHIIDQFEGPFRTLAHA